MVESQTTASSEFFTIPEGAKTVAALIDKISDDNKYYLEISARKQITHDTILLTFKFPEDDWIFGSLVSQHVSIFNKPGDLPPYKPYTSVSPINQKGTVDFVIKVYEKTEQYPKEKFT